MEKHEKVISFLVTQKILCSNARSFFTPKAFSSVMSGLKFLLAHKVFFDTNTFSNSNIATITRFF